MFKVSDRVRLRHATMFRGKLLEAGTEGRVTALLEGGSSRVAVELDGVVVQWPNDAHTGANDLERIEAARPSGPYPPAALVVPVAVVVAPFPTPASAPAGGAWVDLPEL